MGRFRIGLERCVYCESRMSPGPDHSLDVFTVEVPFDPAVDEIARFFCKLLVRIRRYAAKGIEVDTEQMPSVKARMSQSWFNPWDIAPQHEDKE
jgi:hypothetical protein